MRTEETVTEGIAPSNGAEIAAAARAVATKTTPIATAQIAAIGLRPGERLALINWFSGRKWKNYEDRRRRRRLRQALSIMPDQDYRLIAQPVGRNERGEPMYRHIIELGRFVGQGDDRKFQRLDKGEARRFHGFTLTMDQVDYLIEKLKDEETPDGQSDTILDIEDALHAIKAGAYNCPPDTMAWEGLPGDRFVDVKDPDANDDEPEK
jgi:hypothetical protein